MLTRRLVWTIASALSLFSEFEASGADYPSSPESVVRGFYSELKRPGPRPLAQELLALSEFLTRDFKLAIQEAQEADAAYLKKYPTDKGILGDGTCFLIGAGDCAFTSYRITRTSGHGSVREVTVQLTLKDDRPGYQSTSWDSVVELRVEGARWVVSEIANGGATVSKFLAEATADARKAVAASGR